MVNPSLALEPTASHSLREILAAGLALAAFAQPQSAPAKSAENAQPTITASDELRLEIIGNRLATANADRCDEPQMVTGMILQDETAFDARVRSSIKRQLGLTYGFGIRLLAPEGSAARAGLRRGDEILAVNGEHLSNFSRQKLGTRPSFLRTEQFIAYLDAHLSKGPAKVTVRRGAAVLDLVLTGDPGCGGQFTVLPDRTLNAWSDGKYVAVTHRMMRFAADDAELAFVVAHEMAHNILDHNRRLRGPSLFLAQFGIGSWTVRNAEKAADSLAMELIVAAGFDSAAPERFLRRASDTMGPNLSLTHPGLKSRVATVNDSLLKIVLKREMTKELAIVSADRFGPLPYKVSEQAAAWMETALNAFGGEAGPTAGQAQHAVLQANPAPDFKMSLMPIAQSHETERSIARMDNNLALTAPLTRAQVVALKLAQ